MKKYALYDRYEIDLLPISVEPGELICTSDELICTSDDYAEIVKAAKLRKAETDGECELYILTRYVDKEQEQENEKRLHD